MNDITFLKFLSKLMEGIKRVAANIIQKYLKKM